MNSLCIYVSALLFACNIVCASSSEMYQVSISEILASNDNGIKDEDGDREDWFELHNAGTNTVNLRGWWVTDKLSNPQKWTLPEVEIPGNGYLLIWASGKNRDHPLLPLHTNFSLSKSGEYLGLYYPDPVSGAPVLVHDYAPSFPPLPSDVSYGVTHAGVVTNYVKSGEPGRYWVPDTAGGDTLYSGTDYVAGHLGHGQSGGWNVSAAFNDSAWRVGATGIGYDTNHGFDPWIGSDPASNCESVMRNKNTSLCFRRTFMVEDPQALLSLTLKMRYEDGFVAFINGSEVARANFSSVLAYNSKSDKVLNEAVVDYWTEFTVPPSLLRVGANLLAVQGLNCALSSSDFLLLPEVQAHLTGGKTTGYYSVPTPGAPNGLPASGPLLFDPMPHDPEIPRPLGTTASPPLALSVKVIQTRSALASVRFYSRCMYLPEGAPVEMRDDGIAPDLVANDSIYSAFLNTAAVGRGEMLRWRFEAIDVDNATTRLPAYNDPLDTAQYFGTVALDSSVDTSQLNTLYWFVKDAPANGPGWGVFRGSCYYLTNFYDNTGHTIHGQSTRGFPKKSYNFDFTDDVRFRWKVGERRVKDINLLSNYADKTKTRNTIAHWFGSQQGVETPSHFCDPVRVQLNAAFYAVMDLMEDSDDRMLERNGLDPEGALYKIYDSNLTTNAEKKTRKLESNQDLVDLALGLDTSRPLADRTTYAYDHLDLAALVNYLVVRQINADNDHGHKNFLMYRDTNGTREWQPIIWDVDLSFGHTWTSSKNYFDDALYYKPPVVVLELRDRSRVYGALYNAPELRQMWARRMRTLMDTWMQPPGTINGTFETKMRAIVALIDPDPVEPSPWTDGDLDTAKWGIDSRWDVKNPPRAEVERLVAEFFPQRRDYLFNTGAGRPSIYGTLIPDAPQINAVGMVSISEIDHTPASGVFCDEYLILKNSTSEAVDISGWSIDGSISHTFKCGTVIPTGNGTAAESYRGLLHLAKDALAFRSRAIAPTGGQKRFVQGNYQGVLPSEAGTLTLRDSTGMLIFTTNYVGSLSLAQQSLRVTELSYHPAPPTAEELAQYRPALAEDFEYIELKNIGSVRINLTGARFISGISYTFPTSSINPGARLVLAKNLTAFRLRYPACTAPVFGPYQGALKNSSDRLVLIDAGGDQVLDFEYHDHWYPLTDGFGRSLVLRNENIATNKYSDLHSWNVSWNALGSPGAGETQQANSYHGWSYQNFTAPELQNALASGPYADPDGDGVPNWIEYALGSNPKRKDRYAPLRFSWYTTGSQRYVELAYSRRKNVVDVDYDLVRSEDLLDDLWELTPLTLRFQMAFGTIESLRYREKAAATAPRCFYTLRLTYRGAE
ncbi:MAG: lamin tail domain-containing protein [Kiritimatiellae bacterium]|nr:lamin tail domain-containing protein [Kiritimatiellia bacterium]